MVTALQSSTDKFHAAAGAALTLRALQGSSLDPTAALERASASGDADAVARCRQITGWLDRPPPGTAEFKFATLPDLARRCLERSGRRVAGMTQREICRLAMIERGDAYHSTGSFTNLLLDAADKTLLMAYDEAAVTYPLWVRQAPSATDYKALNRIRFGELPDPGVVPEGHEYAESKPSDNKESYRVEKHGSIFSITLEAVVNDDLNTISRIPAMQGNAMRRAVNRACYAVLTDNAAMADGTALFAAGHGSNTATDALDASAVDSGFNVMMTQSGLSSDSTLNLMPRYLIVPAALSATALQLVNSTADPTVGGDVTGTSGTANLYGPGGPRRLVPVIEGQLDGNSTTAWYLACESMQCDTVEVTFLQGEESPVLDREDGFEVDCVKYKVRQSFAAAAVDFRGLYRGNT